MLELNARGYQPLIYQSPNPILYKYAQGHRPKGRPAGWRMRSVDVTGRDIATQWKEYPSLGVKQGGRGCYCCGDGFLNKTGSYRPDTTGTGRERGNGRNACGVVWHVLDDYHIPPTGFKEGTDARTRKAAGEDQITVDGPGVACA